jgi:hypothetical protein
MARMRLLRALPVLVASAATLAVAVPPAQAEPDLTPYSGLGTWISVYRPQAWRTPVPTSARIAARGAQTLYLQTGNYRQRSDLVRAGGLGLLVEAAHAQGLQVVAWYLPSFVSAGLDLRRALAAIRFRTPSGERFDSFALDIEASVVRRVPLRTARLLDLSRRLRAAVGPSYPLGAIIPSPVGMERKPAYWPGFPYRGLAALYDVFLPMSYFSYRARGTAGVRSYTTRSVAIIRRATGDLAVPIHVIGGISSATGQAEARGFMTAVASCAPLGFSLYDFYGTRPAAWSLLGSPTVGGAGLCL